MTETIAYSETSLRGTIATDTLIFLGRTLTRISVEDGVIVAYDTETIRGVGLKPDGSVTFHTEDADGVQRSHAYDGGLGVEANPRTADDMWFSADNYETTQNLITLPR